MAVEDQYRLLRDAGYEASEAGELLGVDPDALEHPPTSSARPSSTPTPFDRYQLFARDIYIRELFDNPELSPADRQAFIDIYEPEPYDPDADDFYHQVVEDYLDELEAEYVHQLEQQHGN